MSLDDRQLASHGTVDDRWQHRVQLDERPFRPPDDGACAS
jgi:hypothetical protein